MFASGVRSSQNSMMQEERVLESGSGGRRRADTIQWNHMRKQQLLGFALLIDLDMKL